MAEDIRLINALDNNNNLTKSIKPKETHSTDSNQKESSTIFIFSSSTTGFLREGAMLPLRWLSDANPTL